jgi:hypothetical protein
MVIIYSRKGSCSFVKSRKLLIIAFLVLIASTGSAWWNSSWEYRKNLELSSDVSNDGVFEYVNLSLTSGLSSNSPQDEVRVVNSNGEEVKSNVISSGEKYVLLAFNANVSKQGKTNYSVYYGNSNPGNKDRIFSDYRVDFYAYGEDWDDVGNDVMYWSNSGGYVNGPDWDSPSGEVRYHSWTGLNIFDMIHEKSLSEMISEGTSRVNTGGDDSVVVRSNDCSFSEDPNVDPSDPPNPKYCSGDDPSRFQGLYIAHQLNYGSGCYAVANFELVPNEYYHTKSESDMHHSLAGYAWENSWNGPDTIGAGCRGSSHFDVDHIVFTGNTYTILPVQNLASIETGAEEKRGICDSRGPMNQCIVDTEKDVSGEKYEIQNIFEVESTSELTSFGSQAGLSIFNSSRISGIFRGNFNISSEGIVLKPGASFRPEERIILDERN